MAAPVFPRTVDLNPREVPNCLTPVLRQRVRAWIAAGVSAPCEPGRNGIEDRPSTRTPPPAIEPAPAGHGDVQRSLG